MEVTLNITLQPKQRIALELSNQTPVLFYGGAKGGGKSYLVRAREVLRRLKYPNTKGLIVRKTFPELLSNHIEMFFKEYPETRQWYNKSEKMIRWPNGSSTSFSYLGTTDDVYTYQGREYEDISIDEITQHQENVFKILRSSCRTTNPNIKPRMLLTGNPGGVGHQWVKRIFIDRNFDENENPTDFAFVPAKITDNAALMENDPDYILRLNDLPEHLRKAYRDGDWDIVSGQVFTDWRRDTHVINEFAIPPEWNRWISMDWGVNAPFCVLWFVEGYDKRVLCIRELYMNGTEFEKIMGVGLTPKKLAKTINLINSKMGWENYEYMMADPSCWNHPEGGESIAETMMNEGLKMVPADNERLQGLARVREYLSIAPDGKPYLQFFKSCVKSISTIPALSYDERKLEDVDTSLEDHAYDCVRYMLMSRPITATHLPDPVTNLLSYDYKKRTEGIDDEGEVILEM